MLYHGQQPWSNPTVMVSFSPSSTPSAIELLWPILYLNLIVMVSIGVAILLCRPAVEASVFSRHIIASVVDLQHRERSVSLRSSSKLVNVGLHPLGEASIKLAAGVTSIQLMKPGERGRPMEIEVPQISPDTFVIVSSFNANGI